MATASDIKSIVGITAAILGGLMGTTMAADAAPSLTSLEHKIAHINATFVQDNPSMWGPKADAIVAKRLVQTERAWRSFRELRCHTLAGVRGADQGAVCVLSQTHLRLAELTDEPDPQLEAAMEKVNHLCQDGTAYDQSLCNSEYTGKRDARVAAFIAGYSRLHGQQVGRALSAVYTKWKIYADGACSRTYYAPAPSHPSSEGAWQGRCLMLLSLADLAFIDGWQ